MNWICSINSPPSFFKTQSRTFLNFLKLTCIYYTHPTSNPPISSFLLTQTPLFIALVGSSWAELWTKLSPEKTEKLPPHFLSSQKQSSPVPSLFHYPTIWIGHKEYPRKNLKQSSLHAAVEVDQAVIQTHPNLSSGSKTHLSLNQILFQLMNSSLLMAPYSLSTSSTTLTLTQPNPNLPTLKLTLNPKFHQQA